MSVSGFYTLEMKINGVDFPTPLNTCTFALKQSIFELYPQLVLTFSDLGGVLQENFAIENGTKIEIRLLVGDTPIFRTLFYAYKQDTDEIKDVQMGTADYTIRAIHVMAWKQFKKSRAFRNRISEIVKTIGAEYGYQVDMNDTGNADTWYQCNITDGEFLMNQLLPNVWSHNAEGTPFYLYLDLQNVLHLRHMKSFLREKPKFKLWVTNNSNTIILPDGSKIVKNSPMLLGYNRSLVNMFDYEKAHLIDTWEIARETGNVARKVVNCFNQPKTNSGHLLYINPKTKSLNLTGTGFSNPEVGREETTKGSVIQQSRLYPGVERITLVTVFHYDTWLNLGDRIELVFLRSQTEAGALSEKMTDTYLVVESDLMWDREKEMMTQKLVLTRNSVKLAKGLKAESKFYKLVAQNDTQENSQG